MRALLTLILCATVVAPVAAQTNSDLIVRGTVITRDGKPFPYTGISFFNAIYNPTFNRDPAERTKWLEKFRSYGINVLRVWAQWDNKFEFADVCPKCSLYYPDGRLRDENVRRLKEILTDADKLGMVVQLVLMSQESWNHGVRLAPQQADRAFAALAKELLPHRNLTIQIWNEFAEDVPRHLKTIKAVDPRRLVTNSPGTANHLGDHAHNQILDFLTPHTSRQKHDPRGRHWELAPREIAYLMQRYGKPVVDDEPARNGTAASQRHGGPAGATYPFDHILQIQQVWQLGAYVTYHHDMVQADYGAPSVPEHGIPDPEFNSYHRTVLEFIRQRERYQPPAQKPHDDDK